MKKLWHGIKITIGDFIRAERREAEILPPWYYGYAYRDYCMAIETYYIIPLNYFVIVGMTINILWNRFRRRPTWIDRQIKAIRTKLQDEAYLFREIELECKTKKLLNEIVSKYE